MSYTRRFTEENRIDSGVYPDSHAEGDHATSWLSMRDYHRASLVILVGEMQAGATLDVVLQEATDSSGTSGKPLVSGNAQTKAITQLTQAGGDGDCICVIELQTEEMDVANAFDYIRAVATVAGAAVEFALLINRYVSRFPPVGSTNLQEVIASAP